MDKKEALKNINYKLKEINDTRLSLNTSNVETIEIEMALLSQQLIDLYALVRQYRSGFFDNSPLNAETKKEQEASQVEPKIKEEIKTESRAEPDLKRSTKDATQRRERLKRLEAEAERLETQKKESVPAPAPKGEEEYFSKIVEEKFDEADIAAEAAKISGHGNPAVSRAANEMTLNEKLQSGRKAPESINDKFVQSDTKKTLAEKMKFGTATDLKSAMDLNQKIAFTNGLFGGNDKEFKKTITFLNNCRNFSEAKFYLQSEVSKIQGWDGNDPLAEEFTEIVYRKFL